MSLLKTRIVQKIIGKYWRSSFQVRENLVHVFFLIRNQVAKGLTLKMVYKLSNLLSKRQR